MGSPGRRLTSLSIHDARVWFESESGPEAISGRRLLDVSRRGKYILLRFEGGITVLQHLRMTGKMLEAGSSLVPGAVRESVGRRAGKGLQIRCAFRFEGIEIWFFDTRRFGTLTLTHDEERFFANKKIAPDPIHETSRAYAWFRERLAKTGKPVKAALLDQGVVAGVGNIYADEALFAARLHPRLAARKVREPLLLWNEILRILGESILQGGSTIRDYVSAEGRAGSFASSHQVYGRAGEPCPACGAEIARIKLGGRSTHFCASCQGPAKKAKARKGKSVRAAAARSAGKPRPRRSRRARRS